MLLLAVGKHFNLLFLYLIMMMTIRFLPKSAVAFQRTVRISPRTPIGGSPPVMASLSSLSFSSRSSIVCRSTSFSNNISLRSWGGQHLSSRTTRQPVVLFSQETTSTDGATSDHLVSDFAKGDKIQVEVLSFGPLGASVGVVSRSHEPDDWIPESQPYLAKGLILHREIHYFRQARDNVDVVRGEILPAYVERVRDDLDGKLDVSLRTVGGKQKALETAQVVWEKLQQDGGKLSIGDKSTPGEIAQLFPGVSKNTFKRALSQLFKTGRIEQPQPHSVVVATNTQESSP